jgi:sec-independent protein translocase protein TatC
LLRPLITTRSHPRTSFGHSIQNEADGVAFGTGVSRTTTMSNATSNATSNGVPRDPDDFFQETRMSFGDHIEELRVHLWRAIAGLGFCLIIGFILDGIGYYTDWKLFGLPFGIGRPLTIIMQAPVERALQDFDDRMFDKAMKEINQEGTPAAKADQPRDMNLRLSTDAVAAIRGVKPEDVAEPITVRVQYVPSEISGGIREIMRVQRPRTLTTLSVQEALVVYFKVSLVAGLVIASPWVFWQIWSFVAAGLYPHEKRLVHVYLPFSLFLFLAGVFVCQFLVMPQAVSAMLWFNEWMGMTPDLRLNEWLSFAIWMPVVFGVSFQTPLVMLFMGKLGIADVAWFSSKRKYAFFAMAVFAAFITPSPDAITMLLLAIPMCLLYELGIILIKLQPPSEFADEESETDELVEV